MFGQGYVALSRVRSLAGLKVLGMHPNALQVDPKVVNRDKQFHAGTETAEDTFMAMSDEELTTLHTQFVVGLGGKMPDHEVVIVAGKRAVKERIKKLSTLDETKNRWQTELGVKAIAKERAVSPSTIAEHLEKLVEAGDLPKDDLVRAIEELDETGSAIASLKIAIAEHGDEKLKPLYEATEERYGYELIRLVRAYLRST